MKRIKRLFEEEQYVYSKEERQMILDDLEAARSAVIFAMEEVNDWPEDQLSKENRQRLISIMNYLAQADSLIRSSSTDVLY